MPIVSGFVSDLDRKDTESIAYRHDQDRRDLQHFVGESAWDHEPLLMELARQVGEQLGRDDGVLVFDPSAPSKKETAQNREPRRSVYSGCGAKPKTSFCASTSGARHFPDTTALGRTTTARRTQRNRTVIIGVFSTMILVQGAE